MKNIKLIYLKFNLHSTTKTSPSIDIFRSVFIKKVGDNNTLLHNHIEKKFNYSYPLIQFKVINNFYYIIGINEGAEILLDISEEHKLNFSTKHFTISEEPTYKLITKKLNTLNTLIPYKLTNWFALNETNYNKYNNEPSLIKKIEFLQSILNANILSFAKGIQWTIDKPITSIISSVQKCNYQNFKDIKVLTFDISFYSNIILPDLIGLGKSASKGFGILKKITTNTTHSNKTQKMTYYDA